MVQVGEKFAGVDFEGYRKSNKVDRGDVPSSLLDATDVIAVESGPLREFFLGQSEKRSLRPHAFAKGS